jgi:hypothetical protein
MIVKATFTFSINAMDIAYSQCYIFIRHGSLSPFAAGLIFALAEVSNPAHPGAFGICPEPSQSVLLRFFHPMGRAGLTSLSGCDG